MLDSDVYIYETRTKLVIADPSERERGTGIGDRELIRRSRLSQTTVYKILEGKPVRRYTLSRFRQAVDRATGISTGAARPVLTDNLLD